ncbi:hypothetical protein ACMD2_00370 [Ananas comosus]|uniref:DUF7794 domain-containing protein n=1 Tax=Ananas comosus TaxID=4615 RepID=A0A199URW8_ANACO|nr:hypothetical protein ACMD2_00370 [Ananas comosus]
MDLRVASKLHLLILVSFLFLKARGGSTRSVVFIDGASHKYIRNQQLDGAESNLMALDEVAATTSVLLGFAPPLSLADDSSAKLNKVLLPNPFDRPRAVFMLEVDGVDDTLLSSEKSFKSRVGGASKAEIRLPGEDEVSIVRLDESLDIECNAACLDQELKNLADWLGGSYVDGEMTLPLASGNVLKLHVLKEADLQFASSLVSFLRTIRRGVEIHEDLAGSIVNPAELLIGRFTGIKALEEEYGSGKMVSLGMEVFQTVLTKSFDLLQNSYGGKIVGVVIFNKEHTAHVGAMIDVVFPLRISRWLDEVSQANSTDSVTLVRRTLAWTTGIILLVSTILGVCFLMNMPLTRDTLLYSNVKLD